MIEDLGQNNVINVGEGVVLQGKITGSNNVIDIAPSVRRSSLTIRLNGDNNRVVIGPGSMMNNPIFYVGNHIVKANRVSIEIGEFLSTEPHCAFFVYNSGNRLKIGDNCMFSTSIILRCGDAPHLVFDDESGAYMDVSEGVFIGNKVWVGEKVYITKNVTIPDESIVAACAVVTRRFDEPHVVLGGNPAKIVKRGVRWFRNEGLLPKDSKYAAAYKAYKASRV